MAASPIPLHRWIVGNVYRVLHAFVSLHRLGILLMAPLEILIRRDSLRTRQPDLLFLSAARSGITEGAQLRGLQLLQQVPDLVIEILSPINTRRDLDQKLEDYRSIGVRECWIVSPEALTMEVMRLSAEGIHPPRYLRYRDDGSLTGPGRACPPRGRHFCLAPAQFGVEHVT